jgi:hypothetical protein
MVLLITVLLAQTLGALDASKLRVEAPRTVAIVDSDSIKGEPWRVAWSPDAQQLYLVAMKRKGDGMELTHHIIQVSDGSVKKVDAEPEWGSQYWAWKSHRSAPGNNAFAIELDQQRKNESATSRPMGGDLARGGTSSGAAGASIDEVANQTSSNVLVITLLLKGEVLGQWKGEPFVPGLTFGWGPAGSNVIAFAGQDRRLVVMDEQGRKQKIDDTKEVRLPAWSQDGKQLAWVEKQDRKKYRIRIASVQ